MGFTRTVAFRLFLLIASVAAVVLFIFTFVAIRIQQEHLFEHVFVDADRLSNVITRSTRHSMLVNQKEDVQKIIGSIGGEPGIDGIRIYNKLGDVTFATVEADLHSRVDMSAEACVVCHPGDHLEDARPVGNQRSRIFRTASGERVLGLITPIRNEPACSNAACHAHPAEKTVLGVLDVKMSLARLDQELEESTSRLIVFSIGAVLALSLISGLFIRRVVHKPVHKLITGMKQVASGKLDQSITVEQSHEIGELARQFNSMTIELSRARTELTAWSDTLENKVKEKTKELELAQRQMIQVEKMASLGNLSASVAHELNNPLEGILTFARLLIKRIRKLPLPPEVTEDFTKDLTLVAEESQRCGSIVKNLLLFARKGSGKMETVRLRSILERCLALTSHHAKVNNVRMEIQCTEDLQLECNGNELEQVLLALSVNAIEAMCGTPADQAGGLLTISADESKPGGPIAIRVRDTGIGMNDELKSHIFEPFFTTKSQGKGVGLGLSLVYGIVERHHGSIAVESAPGKGTTFTITMPARQPTRRTEQEHSEESRQPWSIPT
jgi:two-component system NtrC family sensor kinase